MRILFSGHNTCHNRGCEALVRSTLQAVREHWPDARVELPSRTPEADARILGDLGSRVRVSARQPSAAERLVTRAQRQGWPGARHFLWPGPVPAGWRRRWQQVDLIMAVGGDNYTLDYGIPSGVIGFDAVAARAGVPVVLWGASVGPFGTLPAYERAVRRGLSRYVLIGARESVTLDDLQWRLRLPNVRPMVDPAFFLTPGELPAPLLRSPVAEARRVVGINLSPLVAARAESQAAFHAQALELLRGLLMDPGTVVVLIPHVTDPNDPARSDYTLHAQLAAASGLDADQRARLVVLDDRLGAAASKAAVQRCDLLLTARTHLAIAGYSQGVPVVALGYSRKAAGLTRDVYGDAELHLAAADFSAERAQTALAQAEARREELRAAAVAYGAAGRETNWSVLGDLHAWLSRRASAGRGHGA